MLTLATFIDALADPAKTLEAFAQEQGLALRDVIAEADVSKSTLNRWKSGHFDPRVGSVRKIAQQIQSAGRRAG